MPTTITSAPREFKRQNHAIALGMFFISGRRYLEMAGEHDIAVSLAGQDIRSSHDRGALGAEWEQGIRDQAGVYATSLRKSVGKSLGISLFIMLAIVVSCAVFGFIGPSLRFSLSKSVTAAGAFFALWGTLLQSYPPVETYKGEALHEQVHALMLKSLIVIAAVGIFASLM